MLVHDDEVDAAQLNMPFALVSGLIAHPGFFSVVAECDGRIVGSSYLDEHSMIVGVSHVTVAPDMEDRHIGEALVTALLQRSAQRRVPGVRLLQATYHYPSMNLYAELGFDVREPFAAMQGDPLASRIPGYGVRQPQRPTSRCATHCVYACTATTAAASCSTRSPRAGPGWSNGVGGSPGTRPGSASTGTR